MWHTILTLFYVATAGPGQPPVQLVQTQLVIARPTQAQCEALRQELASVMVYIPGAVPQHGHSTTTCRPGAGP